MALDPTNAALSAVFLEWDLEAFPHIIGRVKSVTPTEEVTIAMLQCFEQLVSGPGQVTIMFDVTNANVVSLSFLKRVAKFMQSCKPKILQHLHCSTVVCGSSTKMLLDVFFTFFTPARPNRRFRNEAEAVKWTLAQWNSALQQANKENAQQ
jgi:hypothetical protein